MTESLPIAILVPTHGRPELLKRTVHHILNCRPTPKDRLVRLIVIENGARDGVEQYIASACSSWMRLEYRHFQASNKSAALNSVVGDLENSLVIFLDDDVRVDPSILRVYASASEKHSKGCFFGGGLLVDYEYEPEEWLVEYLPMSSRGWHPLVHQPMGKMQFFGANWAAFSSDINRLGGFDAAVGPGSPISAVGQETAMQHKLIMAGLTPVYLRDAVVWHYVPKSRCSPKWALERAYRTAVTTGLRARPEHFSPSVLGTPRWLLRSILINVSRWLSRVLLMRSAQSVFEARFKLVRDLGKLKGMRAQRNLP